MASFIGNVQPYMFEPPEPTEPEPEEPEHEEPESEPRSESLGEWWVIVFLTIRLLQP